MLKYQNNSYNPENLSKKAIDRLSTEMVPDFSRVLEIGCATGFTSQYLKRKKNCEVVGVELRKEEARIASKIIKVIQGDIEDKKVIQKINKMKKFDIVFASALVEHLKDPWSALSSWKSFLNENGHIVVTTSNIAHFSARLKIIIGKFQYEEYGLFDNTHLRFFTTETFPDLFSSTGYTIQAYKKDTISGGYPKISNALGKVFPNLFTYQMVIKASK